jgi:protein-L-isoaspartate(D-aspartate) O-methyltransferase
MGGSVSSGRNNDELIDHLVESGFIKSHIVERVFRAVDRGLFYLPKFKQYAYRDLAWREGNIHISAPCIYTRVMEALELRPNQSFLNIGSGTGYLSAMVGLILGSNGVNHNIELHQELIEYARERLHELVKSSVHFDDFDFCMPRFVHGNFLNLDIQHEDTILYDRIYVGAGVSDEHEDFIKSLLKINGIVVMPLNDCVRTFLSPFDASK